MTIKWLLILLLNGTFLFADNGDSTIQTLISEPVCTTVIQPASAKLDLQYDTIQFHQSQKKRGWGTVAVATGIPLALSAAVFSAICFGLEEPGPGAIALAPVAGGVFMTIRGVHAIREGNWLRIESGYTPSGKEARFRIAVQGQGYFDQNLRMKSDIYSGNYRLTAPKTPKVALEMGAFSQRNNFYGVFGEWPYVGAVAVYYHEWHPAYFLALSAGGKAGFMQEHWSTHDNHHQQYGGPEVRVSLGNENVRISGEAQLWIDRVAQYEIAPYQQEDGTTAYDRYAVGSREVGVSPAVSVLVQFTLPPKR